MSRCPSILPPADGQYVVELTGPSDKPDTRTGLYSRDEPPDWALQPGAYLVTFRRVQDGPSQVFTSAVTLERDGQIDLAAIAENEAPSVLGAPLTAQPAFPDAGEQTWALMPTLKGRFGAEVDAAGASGLSYEDADDGGVALTGSYAFLQRAGGDSDIAGIMLVSDEVVEPRRSAFAGRRKGAAARAAVRIEERSHDILSAGISIDGNPQFRGGWQAPQGLKTERLDAATCVITPQASAVLKRRYRLTLALEGRSAVRLPTPLYRGGLTVFLKEIGADDPQSMRNTEPGSSQDAARNLMIGAVAKDPWVQTLVGALDEDLAAATQLAERAQRTGDGHGWLSDDDPWAGVVSALLITRSGLIERWREPFVAFCRANDWCAETHILLALAGISDTVDQEERDAACLAHLTAADKVGAPTFYFAETLAARLLKSLWYTASDKAVQAQARDAYRRRLTRQSRRLRAGPYFAWEQAGSDLQSGRLPGDRYLVLLEGRMERAGA